MAFFAPHGKKKVTIREKSVNTRPSRHECTFVVQVNIKSQKERKSKKNCYEQKKSANRRSRYILTNNDIYPYDITNIKEQMKE
jgi:uncharacterized membrane protein